MNMSISRQAAGVVLIAAAMIAMCGCLNEVENTDVTELSGFDYTQDSKWPTLGDYSSLYPTLKLEIYPSEVAVKVDGDVEHFLAVGGTPPYSWSVEDISLGTLVDSSSEWVVYRRNAPGDNVVILRDSTGKEMYGIVVQAP